MKKSKILQELSKCDRYEVRKCYWKGSNRLVQYRVIRNLQFVKNVPVKYNKVKPIKTNYIPVSTSKLHFSSYKYPFSLQLNWYYRRKSISFGDIYTKEDKMI